MSLQSWEFLTLFLPRSTLARELAKLNVPACPPGTSTSKLALRLGREIARGQRVATADAHDLDSRAAPRPRPPPPKRTRSPASPPASLPKRAAPTPGRRVS